MVVVLSAISSSGLELTVVEVVVATSVSDCDLVLCIWLFRLRIISSILLIPFRLCLRYELARFKWTWPAGGCGERSLLSLVGDVLRDETGLDTGD